MRLDKIEELEDYLRAVLKRPQRVYIEGKQMPLMIYATLVSFGFSMVVELTFEEDHYSYTVTNGRLKLLVRGDWFDGDFSINSVTE